MKILIVDDEVVSRTKMLTIMETFGECVEVDGGEAAVSAFTDALSSEEPFDLIALDISMPGMSGTDALYEIRAAEEKKEVPSEQRVIIIMVTSHSDKDSVITCLQAGCNDYIVKPFDAEIVRKKIEAINSKGDKQLLEKNEKQ